MPFFFFASKPASNSFKFKVRLLRFEVILSNLSGVELVASRLDSDGTQKLLRTFATNQILNSVRIGYPTLYAAIIDVASHIAHSAVNVPLFLTDGAICLQDGSRAPIVIRQIRLTRRRR